MLPPIPPEVLLAVRRTSTPHATRTFCQASVAHRSQKPGDHRHAILVENRVVAQRLSPSFGFYLGRKSLEIMKRAVERLPPNQTLQSFGSANSISEGVRPSESSPTAEYER